MKHSHIPAYLKTSQGKEATAKGHIHLCSCILVECQELGNPQSYKQILIFRDRERLEVVLELNCMWHVFYVDESILKLTCGGCIYLCILNWILWRTEFYEYCISKCVK